MARARLRPRGPARRVAGGQGKRRGRCGPRRGRRDLDGARGVRSHYTFVYWTTLLAQWACAGWMCYATWAAPWPKHKTFVKGYYKHSPTCECCGLPMAPDHPGREKWQREKDEREKAEAEKAEAEKAEAEKAEKAEKDADAKKDD